MRFLFKPLWLKIMLDELKKIYIKTIDAIELLAIIRVMITNMIFIVSYAARAQVR